uniref:ATP-dependent helicase n=1 Tax=Pithovirus LCPAC102 TaxID=2506587 RepID=A0A481Z5C8_9VIRU|nr:MAG: ATP-dependent helicase [Pithovirus LCPAC102]
MQNTSQSLVLPGIPESSTSMYTPEIDISTLSISPYLDNIAKTILNYPATMISAPTGSGKSIGIPGIMAMMGYKIMVSVPTVTAAISLSNSSKLFFPKLKIGYTTGNKAYYTYDDNIVYATSKYIKKLILHIFKNGQSRNWQFANILMLDEYHVGSMDNYLIYSLWKYANKQRTKDNMIKIPYIVMASATIDLVIDKFVAKLNIPNRTYNINVEYMNKNYSINNDKLYIDTASIITRQHNSNLKGHILIFVSGKSEVHKIIDNLQNIENANIYPAYSGISPDEFNRIYEKTNKRKIIVATNIIETSVTINNIGLVIDTMIEKIIITSDSGSTRLVSTSISKASAIQRMGRTGRTGDGVCIRMITKNGYDHLPEQRKEEIERLPIYTVLIELINVGIAPDKILHGDKVSPQRILDGIKHLQLLNNIDNVYTVTDIGKFVINFPLSIRNSSTLWNWINSGYTIYPGIVAIALIDSYGPKYTWIPAYIPKEDLTYSAYTQKINEHRQNYFSKYIGNSELETFINIWNDMMKDISLNSINLKNHILKFSKNNSMNNKKLYEVTKIVKQIIQTLESMGNHVIDNSIISTGDNEDDIVYTSANNVILSVPVNQTLDLLRPILRNTYKDLVFDINKNTYWLNYVQPDTNYRFSMDRDALNTYSENKPPKLIILSRLEIEKSGKIQRYISMGLDIPEDQLDNIDIKLDPKQKYLVLTPSVISGKFKTKYVSSAVTKTINPLPSFNAIKALTSFISLSNPNDTPYIITGGIIVDQI